MPEMSRTRRLWGGGFLTGGALGLVFRQMFDLPSTLENLKTWHRWLPMVLEYLPWGFAFTGILVLSWPWLSRKWPFARLGDRTRASHAIWDLMAGNDKAMDDLIAVMASSDREAQRFHQRFRKAMLINMWSGKENQQKLERLVSRVARDMTRYSSRMKSILPKYVCAAELMKEGQVTFHKWQVDNKTIDATSLTINRRACAQLRKGFGVLIQKRTTIRRELEEIRRLIEIKDLDVDRHQVTIAIAQCDTTIEAQLIADRRIEQMCIELIEMIDADVRRMSVE